MTVTVKRTTHNGRSKQKKMLANEAKKSTNRELIVWPLTVPFCEKIIMRGQSTVDRRQNGFDIYMVQNTSKAGRFDSGIYHRGQKYCIIRRAQILANNFRVLFLQVSQQ